MTEIEKLIEAYEEYIKVLTDEINDLIGSAYVHGFRSRNVERGEQARKKIAELKATSSNTVSPVDNIRWVRASERLPEDDMFEDFPQHHIIRYKDDGSRGMFHGGSATYDQLKEIMKEWDYVEWLEEQTIPVDNIQSEEEKKELKRKIHSTVIPKEQTKEVSTNQK